MNRMLAPFLIGFFSFLLMDCGGKERATTQTDSTQTADTVAYTLASLELKSRDCRDEDSACAVVRYSYPELAASAPQALRDSLQVVWQKIFGDCARGQGPRACAEAFIKSYDETQAKARQAGMDYTIPWYSNISISVVQWGRKDRKWFGIEAAWDEFGGGAHPSASLITYHLDPATGRRLGYADLFSDTAALRQRMEQAFYKAYNLVPGKPLSQNESFFEYARLNLPDTWMPEDDSLFLYWNHYELGPYVSGDFEVMVPVKDLYKTSPVL